MLAIVVYAPWGIPVDAEIWYGQRLLAVLCGPDAYALATQCEQHMEMIETFHSGEGDIDFYR